MYDLNQPNDVLKQMRDADMTDEQIVNVLHRALHQILEENQDVEG